ncbi:Ig-like domain-containing protein [Algoriphagus aquatilis]|uniref:Ig-like domain-containing protein n=1 Tax=Algoriphagus aquatilis TaxID=490186 RepID=A0ABW0C031_9BACT
MRVSSTPKTHSQTCLDFFKFLLAIFISFQSVEASAQTTTAFYCDVDAMSATLPMTVTGDLNSRILASSAQSAAIATSDNSRWTTPNPGSGDEVFLWLESSISASNISSMDLSFEGFLNGSAADFSIWARDVVRGVWVRIGTTQRIGSGADGVMTRSITSSISNYVSGGKLIWGIYESVSAQPLNIDRVGIVVNSSSPVAVTGVSLSPTTASIRTGGTQQLTATLAPTNATNKTVTWSSSNTSVATVNATGLVTGVGSGTSTITVTTQDGNKTATSTITVSCADTFYEAESGTMANGAAVSSCSTCSGGSKVGNLYNTASLTLRVNACSSGLYNMIVYYASGDNTRSLSVSTNGGTPDTKNVPNSGGWNTPATISYQVALTAGQNTIRLYQANNGYAPDIDRLFIPASPIQTYAISGYVKDANNAAVSCTVSLSGASAAQATTDANGFYQFTQLNGGNYTVTPSKASYTFTPGSFSYSPLASDQSYQNFTGIFDPTNSVSMAFGANNSVVYDKITRTYDVVFNGVEIISDAIASVKNGSTTLNSTAYTSVSTASTAINDGFGAGTKHTLTLTGTGMPQMQQIFYTYPAKDYFFTEVLITGSALTSNYMSPLSSTKATIQSTGDNRTLFVPFDNDAWITYNAKSMSTNTTNTSSEIGAVYDNTSRKGLVVGSVEQNVWKTGIKTTGTGASLSELVVWGGYTEQAVTRDARAHGTISGATLKSPKIFVGYYSDFRMGMEDYAKSKAIAEPRYLFNWTGGTPFGWNSWGVIQSQLTLSKSKAVVDYFANKIPAFRNDNTAYINLDSYWDNLTPGGLTGDFSQLTEFVNYCKSKGLQPGIYWAPFVDWGKTSRQIEGSSHNYTEAWAKVNGAYHDFDGCRALDPTHPGTKQRIAHLIGRFKASGFTMIKIDFIGHAAIEADSYYDPTVKTGMQAFNQGMKYLIDQLAGQMLVYVAISPNVVTSQYAHMRRVACDAMSSIGNTENTLNSTSYGWWQSHMYNFIDADHMVFGNETEGTNRARFTSGLVTGTPILGDDFSTTGVWDSRIQNYTQNQELLDISRSKTAFQPIEANTGTNASELFVKQIGSYVYVAIVNYGTSSKTFNVNLGRVGLSTSSSYSVKELYMGTTSTVTGSLSVTIPASDSRIYRFSAATLSNSRLAIDSKISEGNANLSWKKDVNSSHYELRIFKDEQIILDTVLNSNEFTLKNYRELPSDLQAKVLGISTEIKGEWSDHVGIIDEISPTMKINKSVTLELTREGKANLPIDHIDQGTFDNDLLKEITLSKAEFTGADLGENRITIRAKDVSGNESSEEIRVTVLDNFAPTLSAVKDINLQLNSEGKATLKWEDLDLGSTDNGNIIERVLSKTEFTKRDIGEHLIKYRIKDSGENSSETSIKVSVKEMITAANFGDELAPSIKLYPNPAKNSIVLEAERTIFQQLNDIEIVDATGKKMNPMSIVRQSGKSLLIDTSGFSDGIYFVRITSDRISRTIKFIIKR